MKKILILFSFLLLTACSVNEEEIIIEIEPDTRPPVITLYEENVQYITIGETDFAEPYATAYDSVDGMLDIDISSNVDINEIGIYQITYDATDESGNQADQVVVDVYVMNKEPGFLTSFSYSSYDLIGGMVTVLDFDNVVRGMYVSLYDGDELIATKEITEPQFQFEFHDLEIGIDYDLLVEGTFSMGPDMGEREFSKPSIKAGTLRKLNNRIREKIEDQELADAIIDLIYLPYNNTEDVILERVSLELTKIDKELVLAINEQTTDRVIFTPLTIPSVYEYFFLQGVEARGTNRTYDEISGVCCDPMVVKYTEGRNAEQILLHEFGHSVDVMLFYWYSHSDEFLAIWEEEKELLFPGQSYYLDYPEEYFAESFAYYYQGDFTRNQLLENAPKTYEIMEGLVDRYKEMYNILD